MRREIVPTLLVVLLLGSVGGFAYFSNHPESPWLERAEPWPLVGPVAGWFRSAYLDPEVSSDEAGDGQADAPEEARSTQPIRLRDPSDRSGAKRPAKLAEADQHRTGPGSGGEGRRPPASSQRPREEADRRTGQTSDPEALLRAAGLRRAEGERAPRPDVRPPDSRPRTPDREASESRETVEVEDWVMVRPEHLVRARAEAGSAVLLDLPAMSYLPVLSRQGEWIEVLVGGERGWIDLAQEPPFNRRKARRGILRHRAEPVQSNDGFVLRAARKLLDIKRETGKLGPYSLYSDVDDRELLELLDRAATLAEESYFARYGRLPSGNPRRSVLLFEREETYRELAKETSGLPGGGTWQAGHAGRGVLGMFVEGRDVESLASTLVHEIAHLLNDRSLAYNLPIWLEEGIAGDLGSLWIEPDPNREPSRRIQIRGGDARYLSLREVLSDGRGPPLATLLALDRENFYRSEIRQHAYSLSFAFVRYLLDGDDSRHAEGFREFLAKIAAGLGANLIDQLGVDGAKLESGFYRWLSQQIEEVTEDLERRARSR